MPSFSYKAYNAGGQSVTGVITAENYQVAMRMLDEQALFPVKVDEGVDQSGPGGIGRKIRTRHLTMIYNQLADLLRAGVPMLRSLDVLAKQEISPALTLLVKDLRENVAGGMSLGDAMGKHPRAFPPLVSSMVKAGEQGGFLEDVLARLAVFSERQEELRGKIIGSMIYPAVLVTAGAGVVTFMLTYVVPKLRDNLRPETFNALTHLVFGVADFLREYYIVVIGMFAAVIVAYSTLRRTPGGQRTIAKAQLKLPVVGKVFTMVAVCRFCRILGTLLHNGVPILQALRISKDSAGNVLLAEQIESAEESVRKGDTLSSPLAKSGLFPLDILDMISVAEESNTLDKVLVQIADTNETRLGRQVDLAVRIIEPVLLVCMAGMVFIIAIALLVPILTMGTKVS
ncbi:MAG: type II secretion system F family protein [Phycisphaerae bacterium]|nr:MAG: type II secretion system F family protein [Planctomycetota bacterium]KAB2942436.1 MAG: type II secretion system F family protein [Phycisphaerae bacterium]MBE7458400.1 type II secretion system F family protein [Planctomycetia bacterium]MCK6465213.1 type II secretion system F family protein [Phycisphaerae bacterium]MCL4718791.1 type II secretion system F family protein [Phycisphaerae bacterium]